MISNGIVSSYFFVYLKEFVHLVAKPYFILSRFYYRLLCIEVWGAFPGESSIFLVNSLMRSQRCFHVILLFNESNIAEYKVYWLMGLQLINL